MGRLSSPLLPRIKWHPIRSHLGLAVTTACWLGVSTSWAAAPFAQHHRAAHGPAGQSLAADGRCQEALTKFDEAIRVRPTDAILIRDRGRCHLELDNEELARTDFETYLGLAPAAPDAERIRTLLDSLEGPSPHGDDPNASEVSRRDHDLTELPATPDDEDDDREEGDTDEASFQSTADGLWLLGPVIALRSWPDGEYPEETVQWGVITGYLLGPDDEVHARLTKLQTLGFADGFNISATYNHAIHETGRFQGWIGGGVAYDNQTWNRIDRPLYSVLLHPTVRFAWTETLFIQAGLEAAYGYAPAPDVSGGEGGAVQYWAPRAELVWLLGSGNKLEDDPDNQ